MTRFETPNGPVEIRELRAIEEMAAAEALQNQVWGAEITPTPKEILIAVQHEGGLAAGAFHRQVLVALVFGFPTRDPAVLHSHMLGTLAAWRGFGIGKRLKWFQRAWCLERGFTCVRWTVDPLRAANAELNIRHLGATASTYYPDYYGPMQGIDAGAPTDRLLVEWQLDGERVLSRLDGPPEDRGFPGVDYANEPPGTGAGRPRLDLAGPQVLVRLPEDFITLSREEPEQALAWRLQTREIFLRYFARGFAVSGFTRAGGPAYLLETVHR